MAASSSFSSSLITSQTKDQEIEVLAVQFVITTKACNQATRQTCDDRVCSSSKRTFSDNSDEIPSWNNNIFLPR